MERAARSRAEKKAKRAAKALAGGLLAAALLEASGAAPLAAQDGVAPEGEGVRVEPIVVTAGRIPRKVSEVASSVTVVSRDDMELRTPLLSGDALQAIPGVDIQRSGGPGNLENIKIRGGLGTHTLVLIDGFPVNSPTLGEFDISSLPSEGFERIEAVRGAQSALYGSNAIAGVVNFIPREGRKGRRLGLGVAGGSFSTLRWSAFAEGKGEGGGFHLAAGGFESDGILSNDKTSLVSFVTSATAPIGAKSTLHAIVFSTDERKEVPIDFGSIRDPNHLNTRRGLLAGARLRTQLSESLAVVASAGVFEEYFDVNDPADPGQFFGFDSLTQTRKDDASVFAQWSAAPFSTTIVGAEILRDRGTNDFADNFGTATHLDLATYNRSLFFQQEIRPVKNAGIGLGARLDRNTEAGSEFNPKATAYYDIPGAGVRVRAAAGRGFRVATLLEKFDPWIGNKELAPEVGHSYDAGVDVRFSGGKGTASATWFYQEFRNLIQFVAGPFGPMGIGEMRNASRALSRGVEAEGRLRLAPKVALGLAYTYSDTWDASDGRRILGIPRQRGTVSFFLEPIPEIETRIDWRVESDMLDAPPNGGDPRRPGYARVDAFARYRWAVEKSGAREIVFTGRAGNILDRRYEERRGYPAPGFNFLLGAEVRI